MSPKRERRRAARQEASLRAASRIQWLSILLILAGLATVYSGLYLAGVIPSAFYPPIQPFWEPTSSAVLVGTIGDLVAGLGIVTLGALGIRAPLTKRALYGVMGFALMGLISDMLGGLYAIPAQATWYVGLFTVLFRR